MLYRIVYTKQAARDAQNIKSAGLSPKAKNLIEILRTDPFQDPPPYERLVGNLSGFYSRRISLQHRLVYQVEDAPVSVDGMTFDGTVKVISMWTHFEHI